MKDIMKKQRRYDIILSILFIILLVAILYIFANLLAMLKYNMININTSNFTIKIKVNEINYSVDYENYPNQTINGIITYSNYLDFNEIQNLYDIMKLNNKTYNQLNYIIFDNSNPYLECNGIYGSNKVLRYVIIGQCGRDKLDRHFFIYQNQTDLWILGHELGHYVQDINDINFNDTESAQRDADNYGHLLTDIGFYLKQDMGEGDVLDDDNIKCHVTDGYVKCNVILM